jgi:hydrogenase expression/formation protein HypE
MKQATDESEVQLVTGDTKVVDKAKGDGIYINTAGIGIIEHDLAITPKTIQPGDVIIINGDLGRHGIAVMAKREGLSFETTIKSDCAPLAKSVLDLIDNGIEIHCLRDLTRGGLVTALIEIAEKGQIEIRIDEKAIPVNKEVQGACEILGLDPLYIANEGRFVAIIPVKDVHKSLDILAKTLNSNQAAVIGEVGLGKSGTVTLKTEIGTTRSLLRLSGEQLPRIC